jgi:carbamoyl-phosphate synthase large subunit
MPKRTDIDKILIIGSGPIIIGQACEFDYSGTQACKALSEEGYRVILVNSNPATIMTDPDLAYRTYIEPITPDSLKKVIEKEKPDALLPTMGGQTGLNVAVSLAESGFLDGVGVELIGAKLEAIRKAEDRELFKQVMDEVRLETPMGGFARTLADGHRLRERISFPMIVRPAFTLGGTGGSVVYNIKEFEDQVSWGLHNSPISEVLIEESVLGWKEYELEVMRDLEDNVVIICSIENFDPMGIHTGDSITVAPAQTLTDREYQLLRDASIKIIRAIGVETGGSNIQFAVDPDNGRLVVIEMNPRVSRSSALASKATGFPIAKIAAKLSVGLTLAEIPNDITRKTPACFEPTLDYVVVKCPRWNFEKFPGVDRQLGTQMKSVGEVMSIGRSFKEALGKAVSSLDTDLSLWDDDERQDLHNMKKEDLSPDECEWLEKGLRYPSDNRLYYVRLALRIGYTYEELLSLTGIDPWFLSQIDEVIETEDEILSYKGRLQEISIENLRRIKKRGISDLQLAHLLEVDEAEIYSLRKKLAVTASFKTVDTCAAEFEAETPYYYSTYDEENEAIPSRNKKIIILGSGPNRIGQGIEFDYSSVHAVQALKEEGYEAIMVNCNPETVSTDYDTSDRLYFEPITFEHVMNIVDVEKPEGVIVQFGGQMPLKLALPLEQANVKILGTAPNNIDLAEDRRRFGKLLKKLEIRQPESGMASTIKEALKQAERIDYPVLIRPSYVLGGRAMEIVYDAKSLETYMTSALKISRKYPILIDRFLEDAYEVDVEAISDGRRVIIGGIMQHIEEAGIHSGDSSCVMPSYWITKEQLEEIKQQTRTIALALNVIGLVNLQFAIKDGLIYVLEVNPRASRTVPFVSKAKNFPMAKFAAKLMVGKSLDDLQIREDPVVEHYSVKSVVFPFNKFSGTNSYLGPEMKSTGEVMGLGASFGEAFAKAQLATQAGLPLYGNVFISVNDNDKKEIIPIAKDLARRGFGVFATSGTLAALKGSGLNGELVYKVGEGRPNIVDRIINGEVQMIVNTPLGKKSRYDEYALSRAGIDYDIPSFTTLSAATAAVEAIATLQESELDVKSLQEYFHDQSSVN